MKAEITETKDKFLSRGLLGFLVGLAMIIPGVSGSTIAIIFKYYNKILYAISNLLKKFKLCFIFLLPIIIGGVIGFAFGFLTIQKLLNIIPFALVSLFAGLMLGSTPTLRDEVKDVKIKKKQILNIIIGFIIPLSLATISILLSNDTTNTNKELLTDFPSIILYIIIGFLVAATQFIPGCSATALLMTMGYYKSITDTVSVTYITNNPSVILVYLSLILGFLIGCAVVSKVISVLIDKFKNNIYFIFIGLSLGSVVGLFINTDMLNVYKNWSISNTFPYLDVILGIFLFITGIIFAYQFVLYTRKRNKNTSQN